MKQDKWITDNYQPIMHLKAKTFFIDFYNMEMAKLVSGVLLGEILNNINNKVNGSTYELFLFGAVCFFFADLSYDLEYIYNRLI
jgi:hypothetical protein